MLNNGVVYLYLCGFFTPPVAGADLRAALVANCFLGALPPVDLRAVCLVRAISFCVWGESFLLIYYFLSSCEKFARLGLEYRSYSR
jgi:hypothetical protein